MAQLVAHICYCAILGYLMPFTVCDHCDCLIYVVMQCAVPPAPSEVRAMSVLPTTIAVSWLPVARSRSLADNIGYAVEWRNENEDRSWSHGRKEIAGRDRGRITTDITQLKANVTYYIQVRTQLNECARYSIGADI